MQGLSSVVHFIALCVSKVFDMTPALSMYVLCDVINVLI